MSNKQWHITREKNRARILRKTPWWQKQIQDAICYYCQQPVPAKEMTMDHIVPLSRGGVTSKANCVPACKKCNNKKSCNTAVDLILQELQ